MKHAWLYLMLLFSPTAFSAAHCTEKITAVILHSNSQLYFSSSETCTTWCQIKWTGQGDKDRMLSLLLTAQTTQKPLVFYWEDISNCTQKNDTYASPGYVMIH